MGAELLSIGAGCTSTVVVTVPAVDGEVDRGGDGGNTIVVVPGVADGVALELGPDVGPAVLAALDVLLGTGAVEDPPHSLIVGRV